MPRQWSLRSCLIIADKLRASVWQAIFSQSFENVLITSPQYDSSKNWFQADFDPELFQQKCDLLVFDCPITLIEPIYQKFVDHAEDPDHIFVCGLGVQSWNVLSCHLESSHITAGVIWPQQSDRLNENKPYLYLGQPYQLFGSKTHQLAEICSTHYHVECVHPIEDALWPKLLVDLCQAVIISPSKTSDLSYEHDRAMAMKYTKALVEAVKILNVVNIHYNSDYVPYPLIKAMFDQIDQQPEALINLSDAETLKFWQAICSLYKPFEMELIRQYRQFQVSDIDFINGEIVQMARQIRSTAPVNETLCHEVWSALDGSLSMHSAAVTR